MKTRRFNELGDVPTSLKSHPAKRNAKLKADGKQGTEPSPALRVTEVTARIDVGLGNTLFIRGQGDGLSWDKGTPLVCTDASSWVWTTQQAAEKVTFKLLLNDQVWAAGSDVVVEAGSKVDLVPTF